MSPFLFTSESVTEGHPDKMADQISDAILDAILRDDPQGRVACETLITTGMAVIAGEIKTNTYVDMPGIARRVIEEIGYNDGRFGFDSKACAVLTAIDEQSPDIAMGVDRGGAGDQGMMFGFAVDETPELMPLPITLAHALTRGLSRLRKSGELPYLRPDGKSQVTVSYDEEGRPTAVTAIVVSTQHDFGVEQGQIREDLIARLIEPVCGEFLTQDTVIHVNPTGQFIIGGPPGDCGLTGRKIIVDTYGGMGRHGGGCFSGKDPSKVDRSAAYAARHIAKNVVAAQLARKCEVQLAYAIGVAEPVSIHVNSFGTGVRPDAELARLVGKHFDLTPEGIIQRLQLRRPIYQNTATYGHFGRQEPGFTWENTDHVQQLA